MTAVLEVENLHVAFSGVVAVDKVSFDLAAGPTTALIGPNGAGKTTVLNLISGLSRGTGSIRLNGRDVSSWRAARRARLGLARSFQTPVLCDDLDVIDNIRLGSPGSSRSTRARAHELYDLFEINAFTSTVGSRLTHRDRRAIEIARALHQPKALLLLDEPAAGLSQDEADDLLACITELCTRTGTTIVLIEHNMPLVTRWAQRAVVLDRGRVLATGTVDEVKSDAAVVAAYLGEPQS